MIRRKGGGKEKKEQEGGEEERRRRGRRMRESRRGQAEEEGGQKNGQNWPSIHCVALAYGKSFVTLELTCTLKTISIKTTQQSRESIHCQLELKEELWPASLCLNSSLAQDPCLSPQNQGMV